MEFWINDITELFKQNRLDVWLKNFIQLIENTMLLLVNFI